MDLYCYIHMAMAPRWNGTVDGRFATWKKALLYIMAKLR